MEATTLKHRHFLSSRNLRSARSGRGDEQLTNNFKDMINAMIRVTINPGLPEIVPIYTCCPCIVFTQVPFSLINVSNLTVHYMILLAIMGLGCGSPEKGRSGEASWSPE